MGGQLGGLSGQPATSLCRSGQRETKCWCSHTQADSCVSECTTYRSRPRGVRCLIPEVVTGGCRVHYQAHVENIGWLPEVSDGQIAGTTGQGRQMKAPRAWLDWMDLFCWPHRRRERHNRFEGGVTPWTRLRRGERLRRPCHGRTSDCGDGRQSNRTVRRPSR